jgi:ADP-heptose:LPS heptosyltransferase
VTDATPRTSVTSTPNVDWTRGTKVLLIRLRSIGDTVLMTPCLQALKDWRPDVQVSVVSEPLAAPILEGHPLIDQLLVTHKTFGSKLALVGKLRREKFDLAFNLHGGTTGMLLAAMSGARRSFAFRDQRASWMLTDRAPGPDVILNRESIHSVEQQLALLHWAGVPMPERPRLALQFNADDTKRVREKLIDAGLSSAQLVSSRFAIVAPGAAFESKRWNSNGFSSVVDHLSSRCQLESIIVAGPGQESLAREVADSSTSNPRLLSGMNLTEVAALIETFGQIFIGNDSGLMHIAAAVGCPVVAILGSSNPDVWRPWATAPYRVIGGERGTPDSDIRHSIDRVSVDDVISAVDQVLKSVAARTL